MTDLQKFMFAAAVLNSGLFLAGCFVAGHLTQNEFAWKLALASAGLCFVSWTVQYYAAVPGAPPWLAVMSLTAVSTSIIAGILAGVSLLFV